MVTKKKYNVCREKIKGATVNIKLREMLRLKESLKLRESLKIVGCYMFFSFLWILFSDKILFLMVQDAESYRIFQTYKGSFFIIFTSFVLFKLIQNSYSKIESLDRQLKDTLTELKYNQMELEKLAYVDHLTGLATRRLLDEKYELLFESAKRSKTMLTLLMLDLDYFKKYNDRYGHLEGDRVLKIVGGLLKQIFKRDGDIVSRYGGEEFVVVLYQTSLRDAMALVEEFRRKLSICALEHKDSPFGEITISVGVNSGVPSKVENSESFLRKADKALYRAKEGGRNRDSL